MAYESKEVKQILVGLTPKQVFDLDSIVNRVGRMHTSRSQLIREAVDQWLNARRPQRREDAI